MKKSLKKVVFLVIFLAILILPCLVFAQEELPDAPASNPNAAPAALNNLKRVAESGGYETVKETTISTIAGNVVAAVLSLLGVIFIGLIIYGGALWMTARGNESQVEKAGTIIKNSVIGLLLIVSAWAIYRIIANVFIGQVEL